MTARRLPPPRVAPAQSETAPLAEESLQGKVDRWRTEHEDLERAADAAGEEVQAAFASSMRLYEEAMAAFERFNRASEKHDDARASFQAALDAVERHWKVHPL